MDDFKKINVNMATKYDFNVPNIVKLRDRSKVHKMINRYARRKLKTHIIFKLDFNTSHEDTDWGSSIVLIPMHMSLEEWKPLQTNQ